MGILSHYTRLAFEFNLSFQNLREYQLCLFLLADFLCGFPNPFFLLVDEYTGILSELLKNGVGTLLAVEKLDELSIGF